MYTFSSLDTDYTDKTDTSPSILSLVQTQTIQIEQIHHHVYSLVYTQIIQIGQIQHPLVQTLIIQIGQIHHHLYSLQSRHRLNRQDRYITIYTLSSLNTDYTDRKDTAPSVISLVLTQTIQIGNNKIDRQIGEQIDGWIDRSK